MDQGRNIAAEGTENREHGLIWADRLVIVLWLLLGGLGGLVYAAWGVAGAFIAYEQVVGCACFAIWFAARTLDWGFTGRIRYGTTRNL